MFGHFTREIDGRDQQKWLNTNVALNVFADRVQYTNCPTMFQIPHLIFELGFYRHLHGTGARYFLNLHENTLLTRYPDGESDKQLIGDSELAPLFRAVTTLISDGVTVYMGEEYKRFPTVPRR